MITNDVIFIINTETTDRTRMSLSDKSERYQLAVLFEQAFIWAASIGFTDSLVDLNAWYYTLLDALSYDRNLSFAQETRSEKYLSYDLKRYRMQDGNIHHKGIITENSVRY